MPFLVTFHVAQGGYKCRSPSSPYTHSLAHYILLQNKLLQMLASNIFLSIFFVAPTLALTERSSYPSRTVRPDPLPHPRTLARGAYRDVNVHAPPSHLGLRNLISQLGVLRTTTESLSKWAGERTLKSLPVSTSKLITVASSKFLNPFVTKKYSS